jgi:hypothetical protein
MANEDRSVEGGTLLIQFRALIANDGLHQNYVEHFEQLISTIDSGENRDLAR